MSEIVRKDLEKRRQREIANRHTDLKIYFVEILAREFFGAEVYYTYEEAAKATQDGYGAVPIIIESGAYVYKDGMEIFMPDAEVYVPIVHNSRAVLAKGFITAIAAYAEEKKIDLLKLTKELHKLGFGGRGWSKADALRAIYLEPLIALTAAIPATPKITISPFIRVAGKGDRVEAGEIFLSAEITFGEIWVDPKVVVEFTRLGKRRGMKAEMIAQGFAVCAENLKGLNELRLMMPHMNYVCRKIEAAVKPEGSSQTTYQSPPPNISYIQPVSNA